jgi:SAM-dependent methyltransferase
MYDPESVDTARMGSTLTRGDMTDLPADLGNFQANLEFLRQFGRLTLQSEILEIGPGTGTMLAHMLSLGHCVQAVDNNPLLIEEAQRRHAGLPIRLVTGHSLPFNDGSFDIVFSFDVFEHIPDSDAHLAEVRRVLRPGGSYLLQTPNRWTNVVFETIRWRSFTCWRDDHCSLHSFGQMKRRLRANGFEPVFYDVPVVTEFFRDKVRRHAGRAGVLALSMLNPDRLPMRLRTNFFVEARRV